MLFYCRLIYTSIFSILVSAKESDGSVHLAIQTLIRNLIERHYDQVYGRGLKKRRKRPRNADERETDDGRVLKLTGVKSVSKAIQTVLLCVFCYFSHNCQEKVTF